MNIFFMNSVSVDTWGGVEKWMLYTADGMRKKGHKIFICGRPGSIFIQRCTEEGFAIFPLKIGSDFGIINIFKLSRFFKKHRIDAIITNLNKDVRLAGLARKISNNPVLLARSGLAILPNNWKYRGTYKSLVDGIITNTDSIKKIYNSYHWLDANFVRVIYNGTDTSVPINFDRELLRQKYDLPEQQPVIGIFGRLVSQKQHTVFLEVAKNILKELPETNFLIVGDGPLKKDIQQYASDLGITENVYMTGFQREVMELYSYCDVVLLTSEVEGLPNTLIEAMLAAKPVIAFDVGGVKELIRSEKTGRTVPPNDIFLMTQKAIEFLISTELRLAIGKEARQFIIKNFSQETMVDKVETYLNDLLAKKQARR